MEMLGPNNNLLMRLMTASTERSRVISGNIANQNTPGYKARTLEFESLLSAEIANGRPKLDHVQMKFNKDEASESRPNGNNVDMEREVSAMKANMLRFEMYATIMQGNANILNSAIHGER